MFSSSPSSYRAHRGGSDYTEDSARLPHGMVRCGYDADTQQYYFRDTATGTVFEGSAETYYGHMTLTGGGETRQRAAVSRQTGPGSLAKPRGEEVGEDGEVPVLEAEEILKRLWDSVKPWREGGAVDSPAVSRMLSAMRRPRSFAGVLHWTPGGCRASSGEMDSSLGVAQGKEFRLYLMAAGEKRTIFNGL